MSNQFDVNITKHFDITVKENQAFNPLFIFTDNDGNSLDLSGAAPKLLVTEIESGVCVSCDDLTFESVPTITGAHNNQLLFNDTISLPADIYKYNIYLEYPNNEIRTLLTGNFRVRKGVSSGGGSELPYKVYSALLKQSATDAPTATVLQNTLGTDIIWSRFQAGWYKGTPQDSRTFDNTRSIIVPFGTWYGSGNATIPLTDVVSIIGYYTGFLSAVDFELNIMNGAFEFTDLSSIIGNDGDIFVEVRIYE